MLGVPVRRLFLIMSFLCVATFALPSIKEGLVVALLAIMFTAVYKNPQPIKSIDQKQFIQSFFILIPAFFIFFIRKFSSSLNPASLAIGLLLSLGLMFAGSYFLCVVNGSASQSKPEKVSIEQTKVPVSVMVYYGIFAIVTMLFATTSSPLYPINYWDDTNIYRTVTECILNGKVLYVGIHEQKGFCTFLMEMPGVLISRDSFFGMYLTEAVVFFLYTLFSTKIVSLFIKPNRTVWALVPVFSLITFTSMYFRYGGCIEELLLPFLTYAFYLGLRVIKTDAMFTCKDAFVIGLITSWVFWSKYIDCGLFFGLIVFVIVYAVIRKQGNKILPLAGSFIGGFLVICGVVSIYFLVNHAFGTMIDAYFLGNLNYAGSRQMPEENTNVVLNWIYEEMATFDYDFQHEKLFFVFVYAAFVRLIVKKEKRVLLYSILTLGFAALFIYGTTFCLEYYIIGLKFFCALGWIPFLSLASQTNETLKSPKLSMVVTVGSVLLLSFVLIASCPSVFKLGSKREDLPQYRFAEKINSIENPKVLNFGFLDTGFFLGADILPFHTHYCTFLLDDLYGYEHIDLLEEGAADFVITNREYEFEDYVLCDQGSYENVDSRGYVVQETFYLYERRN